MTAAMGYIGPMRILMLFLALPVLLSSLAGVATAGEAESGWDATPEARARLIAGVSATGVVGAAPLGLEIVLKEGWKTYWRAPGPQGYAPRLDWSGSENLAGVEIVWPTPKRFQILGFDSIGYMGAVILPLNARFQDPAKPAHLQLTLDYLTCSNVCVPQTATLSLDLPAGGPAPTAHAFAIDRARGQAPTPPGAGVRIDRVWLEGPIDRPTLALEGTSAAELTHFDLFVDGLDGYFFAAPKAEVLDGGRFRLRAAAIEAPLDAAPVATEATYTLKLSDRAIVQRAPLSEPPVGLAAGRVIGAAGNAPGLLLMLAIAFLGGLILNVMPCVLPVLAIKLMAALRHAEGGRGQVRRGFLASAAGIVTAFAALAGGAVALRMGGVAVGWGMQFQQPLFVAAMALAMALFAANLWGLFSLSTRVAANRARGALPEAGDGLAGAFWTGVLATALATPCSAPFVGAALGFALTRGPGEIFAIFLAMGLGLAAPYLLTAAFPGLARLLPRPGRWMLVVRGLMGVAVAATGAWLLWVLWRQAGPLALGLTLAAALAALAALGVARVEASRRWGYVAGAVMGGLLAVWLTAVAPASDDGAADLRWARFDEAEVVRRVAAGEVVLVDVTADWCVTCKWNKAAVLSQDPVAALLAGEVLPMQADWTRPDPVISAYLAKFGRFGIPFNVVYGPGAPEGVTLPELLDQNVVLQAVKKARGRAG